MATQRTFANLARIYLTQQHDDNLSGTLREINLLESQLAKDQKKAETASSKKASQAHQKVADTERSLRQTMDLWDAEAPFAFEAYQRIDAQRLQLMKETVAKFETAQSDAAQRLMGMTEQSMQIALNFDPQVEMQEFVLKSGTAQGRARRLSGTASSNSRNPRLMAGASATAGSRQAPDVTTQSAGVGEFGRSISRQSSDHQSLPTAEQSTQSKPSGGSTLKSALTRFGRGRSNRNAETTNTQTIYGALSDGPSTMAPPTARHSTADDLASIDSQSDRGGERNGTVRARAPKAAASTATSGDGGSLMQPLSPTRAGNASSAAAAPPSNEAQFQLPKVDTEGFSIPPPDRKPWETGKMSHSPGLLDDNDDPLQEATPRMAGMSIAQKPIQEDSEQDQAAFEKMRSTLLTSRSPAAVPQRRNTTRRDRRDVRNTTYNPMMDSGSRPMSTFGIPGASPTTVQPGPSTFVGSPGTGAERSQSMVSSGSASNIGNTTIDSISTNAPVAPGLHAYITERVNVVMKGREVSKIMVVGELSVSAKDVASVGPLHMRVDAYEQLEKAAANPVFMREVGPERPGEYTVDVSALARQASPTSGGRSTVLKYQVHVPSHKASEYVPLHVVPQWRCEAQQTSILINYSANPASRASLSAATQLPDAAFRDVTLSVDVTSPSVSNIMSKPAATYVAEQKKLVWRLAEPVALASGDAAASAHKALARFQVDTPSEVRAIDVRWKLPGLSVSTLDVSLIGTSDVHFGSVSRQVVSGKYTASP